MHLAGLFLKIKFPCLKEYKISLYEDRFMKDMDSNEFVREIRIKIECLTLFPINLVIDESETTQLQMGCSLSNP